MPTFFFFALFTTLFLAIFYNTVTNMAGIYIVSELGGSSDISVYLMVFFGLGSALSIPLANPLADYFGSIRTLIGSLFFYILFSVFCAEATTFVVLNIARFCLGFASGFFYILCRRIIFFFAKEEKKEEYGVITIILFALVPVLGACFGAWVAYESHWRWIFHVNEPIACFLILYFWVFYRHLDASFSPSLNIDWKGYFAFFLGVLSLVTAIALSQQLDWYRSTLWLFLLCLGIPPFLYFLYRSWTHPFPVLALKLLKIRTLVFALLHLSVLFACYFGMIILLALWLNIYANYTPVWVAILLGIMGLASLFAFVCAKLFFPLLDPRLTLALSIFCFLSSCYYSTYFNVDTDFFHLSIARGLAGLGLVLFLFPIFKLCLTSVPKEKEGEVFSLLQVVRSLATSLGAAIFVIIWQRRQIFFRERLGEKINLTSQLQEAYFERATRIFHLKSTQAIEQLSLHLDTQATSLALNDVFCLMGFILLGMLLVVIFNFLLTTNWCKSLFNS